MVCSGGTMLWTFGKLNMVEFFTIHPNAFSNSRHSRLYPDMKVECIASYHGLNSKKLEQFQPKLGRVRRIGGTMEVSAVANGVSSAQQPGTLPVLTLDEVARKLQESGHSNSNTYKAMYSSIVGGITLDPAAMVIPIDDHMVHRGHSVFDTATICDGHLYELDAHLERLLRSAAAARIPIPFSRSEFRNIVLQTAAAANVRKGLVRYWLSTGPGGFELTPSECEKSAFYVVVIGEVAAKDLFSDGVKVITASNPIKRRKYATMKSTNYLPNALAKMEAEDAGAFQSIWLDDEGNVAESTNMNVAFVKGRTLLVPHFDNILSGCTVKRLMQLAEEELAKPNGTFLQTVENRKISFEEAKAADEMMLIVSSKLIVPVVEWDGQPVGKGEVGSITKKLYGLLKQDVTNGPPEVREPVPYKQ